MVVKKSAAKKRLGKGKMKKLRGGAFRINRPANTVGAGGMTIDAGASNFMKRSR